MDDTAKLQELREVAAFEARVVEAQLMDISRLGATRREILLGSIERLRVAATGGSPDYGQSSPFGRRRELEALVAQRSDRDVLTT